MPGVFHVLRLIKRASSHRNQTLRISELEKIIMLTAERLDAAIAANTARNEEIHGLRNRVQILQIQAENSLPPEVVSKTEQLVLDLIGA